MIRYICDICGENMPDSYCNGDSGGERSSAASVCLASDVCPICDKVWRDISVAEVVRNEWLRRVAASKVVGPDDPPKYAGHCGREKVEIYERLVAYRGTPPRMGVLTAVAALTDGKVSADDLRGILNGSLSLPIEKWRLIGKALDKLEGVDG